MDKRDKFINRSCCGSLNMVSTEFFMSYYLPHLPPDTEDNMESTRLLTTEFRDLLKNHLMFKITFNPPTFNNLTLCYMFFYFFSFEDKEGRLPRYAVDVAPIFSREMYNQQNILALGKKKQTHTTGFSA